MSAPSDGGPARGPERRGRERRWNPRDLRPRLDPAARRAGRGDRGGRPARSLGPAAGPAALGAEAPPLSFPGLSSREAGCARGAVPVPERRSLDALFLRLPAQGGAADRGDGGGLGRPPGRAGAGDQQGLPGVDPRPSVGSGRAAWAGGQGGVGPGRRGACLQGRG